MNALLFLFSFWKKGRLSREPKKKKKKKKKITTKNLALSLTIPSILYQRMMFKYSPNVFVPFIVAFESFLRLVDGFLKVSTGSTAVTKRFRDSVLVQIRKLNLSVVWETTAETQDYSTEEQSWKVSTA